MGIVVEFPADAALRRTASGVQSGQRETSATVVILPAIRIERYSDETTGGHGPELGPELGPEQGTAPGRRRKRRARS